MTEQPKAAEIIEEHEIRLRRVEVAVRRVVQVGLGVLVAVVIVVEVWPR